MRHERDSRLHEVSDEVDVAPQHAGEDYHW